MDRPHLFRRIFHLCAPLFLAYYLVPDTFLLLPKFYWVLIVLLALLILEAIRLATGWMFFGLRDYEKDRLSAFAWAGIGITLAFFFFPPEFVACTIFGIGWVDPLIGELRSRGLKRWYPSIPLLAYFAIVFFSLLVLTNLPVSAILVLGITGSMTAVAAEGPKLPVDDDFLMLMVPLLVLTATAHYLGVFGLA